MTFDATTPTSPLNLGGNVFGWTIDEAASFDVLDAFVDGGGSFIDTADVYSSWAPGNSGGESERIIGAWVASRDARARVQIATKIGSPMPEGAGLAHDYVIEATERSRARLGIEQIDLLYAHRPDTDTPISDTLRAFQHLLDAGTIASYGLSNYDAAQLRAALDACDAEGFTRPTFLQPEYNVIDRDSVEGALQDLAVERGIAIAPYYALASGFLTGKYRRDAEHATTSGRVGVRERYDTSRNWELIEALGDVAARHSATHAQVALAWLHSRAGVTHPIASGTTPEQVRELLGAFQLELTASDLDALD